MVLAWINVESAIVFFELPASYVFGCRQIDFHFRTFAAHHGEYGHTGSHCFMRFKQVLVDVTVKGGIQPGIG